MQVKTFKMARKAPFSELQRLVAEEMGVPLPAQRYWKWAARQNSTYRPAQVLKLESEDQPISVSGVVWRHPLPAWQAPPGSRQWLPARMAAAAGAAAAGVRRPEIVPAPLYPPPHRTHPPTHPPKTLPAPPRRRSRRRRLGGARGRA